NDTYGHNVGDVLLQHAARTLQEGVRDSDFVARIGGDEFVALVRFDGSKDALQAISARIIDKMRRPIIINGIVCRSGAIVGIAYEHGQNVDVRQLLLNADIALYQAKEQGRNRSEFFSHESRSRMINVKQMSDEILIGLERDEFAPIYQLQF